MDEDTTVSSSSYENEDISMNYSHKYKDEDLSDFLGNSQNSINNNNNNNSITKQKIKEGLQNYIEKQKQESEQKNKELQRDLQEKIVHLKKLSGAVKDLRVKNEEAEEKIKAKDDEITIITEERDQYKKELSDLKRDFFYSTALSIKLNYAKSGYQSNALSVQDLFLKSCEEQVPVANYIKYIDTYYASVTSKVSPSLPPPYSSSSSSSSSTSSKWSFF